MALVVVLFEQREMASFKALRGRLFLVVPELRLLLDLRVGVLRVVEECVRALLDELRRSTFDLDVADIRLQPRLVVPVILDVRERVLPAGRRDRCAGRVIEPGGRADLVRVPADRLLTFTAADVTRG